MDRSIRIRAFQSSKQVVHIIVNCVYYKYNGSSLITVYVDGYVSSDLVLTIEGRGYYNSYESVDIIIPNGTNKENIVDRENYVVFDIPSEEDFMDMRLYLSKTIDRKNKYIAKLGTYTFIQQDPEDDVLPYNYLTMESYDDRITITADHPVASDINVYFEVSDMDFEYNTVKKTLTLYKGQSILYAYAEPYSYIKFTGISPNEDDTYRYIVFE